MWRGEDEAFDEAFDKAVGYGRLIGTINQEKQKGGVGRLQIP